MPEAAPVVRRPILRSQRLFLRPAEREDLAAGVDWFIDPEVAEGLNARAPHGQATEERWFEKTQREHGKTRWHFSVCLRDGGGAIGFIMLEHLDHPNGSAELIIAIGDRSSRNQGYGREAMGILLDFAFEELRLHRVHLRVFAWNARGVHLYEDVGFTLECTMRGAAYRHGQHHDMHVMGILRDEWAAQDRTRTWELD